jgi:hypothetical protein
MKDNIFTFVPRSNSIGPQRFIECLERTDVCNSGSTIDVNFPGLSAFAEWDLRHCLLHLTLNNFLKTAAEARTWGSLSWGVENKTKGMRPRVQNNAFRSADASIAGGTQEHITLLNFETPREDHGTVGHMIFETTRKDFATKNFWQQRETNIFPRRSGRKLDKCTAGQNKRT